MGGGRDYYSGDTPRPGAPFHCPPTRTPESVASAFALAADVTITAATLSAVAVTGWLPPNIPSITTGSESPAARVFVHRGNCGTNSNARMKAVCGRLAAASYAAIVVYENSMFPNYLRNKARCLFPAHEDSVPKNCRLVRTPGTGLDQTRTLNPPRSSWQTASSVALFGSCSTD